MKIVTSEQMRRIEERSERAGVSTDTLMENAGLAVARRVRRRLGHLTGVPVVVLVGAGNNGGDGLVVARHLHSWGTRVLAYICLDRRVPDPKLDIVADQSIEVVKASEDEGLGGLRRALESAALVVDAVLGTGRSKPIEGTLRDVLEALRSAKESRPGLRIVALDLPTGLDSDTGAVDPACVPADVTVALGHPKVGHYTLPGADMVGTLEIEDIGIPAGLDEDVGLELMTPEWARATLPNRPAESHKGTFGSTMVVAGSRNYVGAAYLAATAATRVGAGLVTIALPEGIQAMVAAKATEPVYLLLPESSPGVAAPTAASVVLEQVERHDAMLIGCGLGQASETRELVESILYSGLPELPPTVVDADGLNHLAQTSEWWTRFKTPAVLTPHPGEMARLLGTPEPPRRAERIPRATEAAAAWNKITVLKGAYTVVAAPDGSAMLSPFANPGLASAGTGDVLAGAIAGLMSQGLSLEQAAALGVYLHGMAGERVARELGTTGMVAGDLLPVLPLAIKELREAAQPFQGS